LKLLKFACNKPNRIKPGTKGSSAVMRSLLNLTAGRHGGLTLNDFLRHRGMSPLFHSKEEAEAFVAEMGQQPHGLRDLFGAALASVVSLARFMRRALVRPAQAPATSAAPPRSAASSEPRQSLTGRDIWPRVTEYRAIPKADTEAHHATERAAPTTFRSQRTAYAPNICRPSCAVHRCRRLPSSQ
jgi:hypothetical protein